MLNSKPIYILSPDRTYENGDPIPYYYEEELKAKGIK